MNVKKSWIDAAIAELPALITTDEACKLLRCGRRHLYRLIAARKFGAIKQSNAHSARVLIPREELERYLRGLAEAA